MSRSAADGGTTVPTLILFGEFDNVAPPGNAELMAKMAGQASTSFRRRAYLPIKRRSTQRSMSLWGMRTSKKRSQ
jgi:hypothetical protein